MLDFGSMDPTGTLLVFDLILVCVLAIMGESLRVRLKAIPDQATVLTQQFATATVETQAAQAMNAREEQQVIELEQRLEQREAEIAEATQRLEDFKNSVPTPVYILEQIIQPSYRCWMVTVRRGEVPGGTAPAAAEPAQGRRYLVFGDDTANARRRIEVRFPPAQGYRASELTPFEIT